MELLVEIILDLALDLAVVGSKSKHLPAFIRYILVGIILVICAAFVGLIAYLGMLVLQESAWMGVLVIAFDLFLVAYGIYKFKKVYIEKKDE